MVLSATNPKMQGLVTNYPLSFHRFHPSKTQNITSVPEYDLFDTHVHMKELIYSTNLNEKGGATGVV